MHEDPDHPFPALPISNLEHHPTPERERGESPRERSKGERSERARIDNRCSQPPPHPHTHYLARPKQGIIHKHTQTQTAHNHRQRHIEQRLRRNDKQKRHPSTKMNIKCHWRRPSCCAPKCRPPGWPSGRRASFPPLLTPRSSLMHWAGGAF
eukprot:scaffold1704_cov100-Isochrysis_galbana.AAC.2